MEPENGYNNENHHLNVQQSALRLRQSSINWFKFRNATPAIRFDSTLYQHNETVLQPTFSAKRIHSHTGFRLNYSRAAMKRVQEHTLIPIRTRTEPHLELNCESYNEQHYSC